VPDHALAGAFPAVTEGCDYVAFFTPSGNRRSAEGQPSAAPDAPALKRTATGWRLKEAEARRR